jgi:hypothetical protein
MTAKPSASRKAASQAGRYTHAENDNVNNSYQTKSFHATFYITLQGILLTSWANIHLCSRRHMATTQNANLYKAKN